MTVSRNEAILQNILGAHNTILPPFSRIEALLIEIAELIASGGDAEPITDAEITEIINTIE